MTVVDTSAVVDYLLGSGVAGDVQRVMERERVLAAPDVLVFEVLAVLRRWTQRNELTVARARGAIDDLGDLPLVLYPALALRARAWELRDNFTAADALFTALAEQLHEPLATKDAGLAAAARDQLGVATLALG